MIRSFGTADTERLWERKSVKGLDSRITRTALRKLVMIHAAVTIDDLRIPPGNRLESMKGNRQGQHSIRINDQWRICFTWVEGRAENVEIVDYH
ncbi:MAG: type II toxin-antitoxin system RelE/ParE family toxin [Actinomycetales bacterium]|nr:type II toxin-antitoxin system RelE/ParE family toxin [Actinomycetales bacterium]